MNEKPSIAEKITYRKSAAVGQTYDDSPTADCGEITALLQRLNRSRKELHDAIDTLRARLFDVMTEDDPATSKPSTETCLNPRTTLGNKLDEECYAIEDARRIVDNITRLIAI